MSVTGLLNDKILCTIYGKEFSDTLPIKTFVELSKDEAMNFCIDLGMALKKL